MTESFITILLLGLLAGFFFSVPIAGPISILITSNALKGNTHYCNRVAIGGSLIEFIYVFIAVFGLTALYSLYNSIIPYILIIGSIFLFVVGIKIFKMKLDIEEIVKGKLKKEKYLKKGGLRTGIFLNATNPSLFLGWFTSSFLLLTFASSIGLNTGGLDLLMQENVTSIEEITGKHLKPLEEFENGIKIQEFSEEKESLPKGILSLTYAGSVAIGTVIWFYFLTKFLIKFRNKLNINLLNGIIKVLGLILIIISIYLIYEGFILMK